METKRLPYKTAADMINRHTGPGFDYMSEDFLNAKMAKWPFAARQAVWGIRDGIETWQGGGGYGTSLGRAARDYIKGGAQTPARYDHPTSLWIQAQHIVEAVRNAPERQGSLYRIIPARATYPAFEDAKPGDVLHLDSLSSFSRSKKQADGFARSDRNNYRIIIDGHYKGIDAKFHGDFVGEQETITYGRFRVIRKYEERPHTVEHGYSTPKITNIVVRQLETN